RIYRIGFRRAPRSARKLPANFPYSLSKQAYRRVPRAILAPQQPAQSGRNCRAIQTGTPRAPARWATDVSAAITRSRFFMTASVSMNGPLVSSRRGDRERSFPDLLTARAFLKDERLDAVQSGERSKLGEQNAAQTVPGMPGRLNW